MKREFRERRRVHDQVMDDMKGELDYSKRMLDRVKKYGSPEGKDHRKKELRRKIDEFKKERWRPESLGLAETSRLRAMKTPNNKETATAPVKSLDFLIL